MMILEKPLRGTVGVGWGWYHDKGSKCFSLDGTRNELELRNTGIRVAWRGNLRFILEQR